MTRRNTTLVFALFCGCCLTGVSASAQMSSSPIPGMEKQCVLNHPYHADLAVAMTGKGEDAKKTPLEVGVPGEIVRDSDGRQKMVMNMEMPELKEPMQIVMIFDPPAGKVIILDTKNKKEMVRDMPQVHCAPTPPAPDFSELSKAGMKVTDLGTKDFGELHATGYRIGIDLPVTDPKGAPVADAKPAGMEMVLWMDLSESIPVSMKMKVADQMNMDMEFTNVKLGEPSPSEFKIPAGYTEVKIPNLEIPDEKAAPPTPSKP